ncbi:hypothetical protein SLEP1_g17051 [Rubroshorea leprosula]|uniref:Secreted protein n=1 Tax=Rubroshorea leprosula TaxID=152421 RepID=A0AAV5J217_9ROSI|nr:hypothetical protein SLEP1_g17051 [Rubroshorea leprosula]
MRILILLGFWGFVCFRRFSCRFIESWRREGEHTQRDDGGDDWVSGHGRFRSGGGSGGAGGEGVVYCSLPICFALDGEAAWLSCPVNDG